jgi:hypothetical protein
MYEALEKTTTAAMIAHAEEKIRQPDRCLNTICGAAAENAGPTWKRLF